MPKFIRELFLFSLLVSVFLILSSVVYLNRNYFSKLKILTPIQKALQTEYKFGKVTVSKSELEEAIKLENKINQNEIAAQSATQSSKAKLLSDTNIESAARERVIKRKILEVEAAKLGIDLKEITRVSSGSANLAALPPALDPAKFPALARLAVYDSLLSKAAKDRVEGYYLVRTIDVSPKLKSDPNGFMGMAAVSDSQKNEVLGGAKRFKEALESRSDINELLTQTASFPDITVLSQDLLLSKNELSEAETSQLLKFAKEAKPNQVETLVYGYNVRVVKLLQQSDGVSQSFDDWYGAVSKNYL